jgi:hypothetical protein
VAFRRSGTEGYDDLIGGSVHFDVFGVDLAAARLEAILRSKRLQTGHRTGRM